MTNTIEKLSDSQYFREKVKLVLSWVDVHQCQKCTWPVIRGYCCTTCGAADPGNKE